MLAPEEIQGQHVIEAGSMDVNGSVRGTIMNWQPASYIGTDILAGPGVDVICAAEDLAEFFRDRPAGVVVSAEMLEHVVDWQAAMAGLIGVLAPGGVLILTTRSPGFGWHPYPVDTWRYTVQAIRQILALAGLEILACREDPDCPGVLAKARKPEDWEWPDNCFWSDVAGVTAMEEGPEQVVHVWCGE